MRTYCTAALDADWSFFLSCAFADDGLVLKLVIITGHNVTDVQTIFIEEIRVFEETPIRKLTIARPTKAEPSLLIMSDSKFLSIPLERCNARRLCE